MAGRTGLEPVASGVTGSEEGVAETGNAPQPHGTVGNRSARSTDFGPGLGGLFRRRVTPELQSIRSQEIAWPRLLSFREVATLLGSAPRLFTSSAPKESSGTFGSRTPYAFRRQRFER